MAETYRRAQRKGQVPIWLVGLTVVAGIVAVLPIAAAIVGGVAGAPARTAFASAPPGAYVVGTRAAVDEDTIVVAPAHDPAAATDIATVGHLPGHPATGAVSPDGRWVALAVADAGTPSQPGVSLLVVELESGAVTRLDTGIDPLQTPAWTSDSAQVLYRRSAPHGEALVDVTFVQVPRAGGAPAVVSTASGVLGAYAVGFDVEGRLVSVVIDGRGSTLVRDSVEVRRLSAHITRDWQLSPDGRQIAFVESDVSGGLAYRSRVEAIEEGHVSVLAQSANAGGEALGAAWSPAGQVAFGREPGAAGGTAEVMAQSVANGFDVPLAYAPDGSALAVQAWSGDSFDNPGEPQLMVTDAAGRRPLEMTRFFGWATR